jgi:hypothetical protein
MATNKTQPTPKKVSEFIAGIEDGRKRADCKELMKLMREVTGKRATMWGPSIVGFGKYHYKYASGREGDFFLTGFAARKQALTIYIINGFEPHAGKNWASSKPGNPACMSKTWTTSTGRC